MPFRLLDLGWVKKQDPDQGSDSGMNSPDHISESLETIFWIKLPKLSKFFDADSGAGMEKIRIRDGRNSDPG